MNWHVELSRPAVEALRVLPRAEQRRVAATIRAMERAGPPRGSRDAGSGVSEVRAGGQRLLCLVDPEEQRITVATLGSVGDSTWRTLGRLISRRLGRVWRGGTMEGWVQDLGYALRALRKAPGFVAVAVMTLTLGVGAATAVFSVAEGVLMRPLPYGDPDRVATIYASWDNFPDRTWVGVDEFQLWHQESRALEDAALYYRGSATFTDVENPEQVAMAAVTPNLFDVLGVHPVVGRGFTWEEARLEDPPVLLSWDAWTRRYARDREVVGREVEIDGQLTTVLGVLPRGFALPPDFGAPGTTDLYEPLFVDLASPAPNLGGGGNHGAWVVGRLREGVTVEEARLDLERVQSRVAPVGLYAPERNFHPKVFRVADDVVGAARRTIRLLLVTVALVLLIACGNVANLLLSRGEVRAGEMAVRSALGASRGRLVRQLLLESTVLAGAGGLLGLVVGAGGVRGLLAIDPDAVPRAAAVSLNGTVALFTVGVGLATVFLSGLGPALRVSRVGSAGALRDGGARAGRGRRAHRVQGVLVAVQMAMGVVLLTGAGLLGRSFIKLLEVDPGFAPGHVLTLRLTTPPATYPDAPAVVGFYRDLLRRVRALPGVRAAGGARLLPLASTMGDSGFEVDGYDPAPGESLQAEWQFVTPGYLEVMGIPLLAGRTFDGRDDTDGPGTIIVNEALASRYFHGRNPVGATMYTWGDTLTVVGVVGNVAHNSMVGPRRYRYYRPHAQVRGSVAALRSLTLTVETEGPPLEALDAVRREIRALDPSIPVARVQTMDQVLSGAVARPRFTATLMGVFAAVALVLAAVGVYGVLSHAVSRRTREIGVRMALGAERRRVVRLVVRQGMATALLGVVVGAGAGLALSGLLEGTLYGVPPTDPLTFVGMPLFFAAVALVACLLPAFRASRVDPAEALRSE